MKNFKIVALLVFVLSLTSCSIHEKMIVKENLETKYSVGFDLSSMFKMDKNKDKDKSVSKKIDSTFSFAELIELMPKDSLAKLSTEERNRIEKLKFFKINLQIDEEKGIMAYDFEITVPNINENKDFFTSSELSDVLMKTDKNFGNVASLTKDEDDKDEVKTKTNYFYDGSTFTKTTLNKITNPKKIAEKKEKKKAQKDDFAQLGEELDKLLKECKYIAEYHFPRKIKSVNLKGAVISKDKKSFAYQIPFEEYDKDLDLDFKVIFE